MPSRKIRNRKGELFTVLLSLEDLELFDKFRWSVAFKERGKVYRAYVMRSVYVQKGYTRTVYLHREILGLTDSSVRGDHKNHNTLDNRRSNLRICSISQNGCNRKKRNKKALSSFKGVTVTGLKKNPWRSVITINGNSINLGNFPTEIAAASAYNKAAIKIFGQHACLNKLTDPSLMSKKGSK